MIYNYSIAYFLTSVSDTCNLPPKNIGKEIAFVGYSNCGKSRTINTLTAQKKLTKVSKKPGCTRFINFFKIRPNIHIIDFPGYGYASWEKQKKNNWNTLICKYLTNRKNLKGLVLIMDIRNPLKKLDQKIIENTITANIPISILLNKSDKIPKNYLHITTKKITQKINTIFEQNIKIIPFSATTKYGIKSLKNTLNHWLR